MTKQAVARRELFLVCTFGSACEDWAQQCQLKPVSRWPVCVVDLCSEGPHL